MNTLEQTLEKATKDLLFQSETDAPIEPFFWLTEATEPDESLVASLAGAPDGAQIEALTLEEFFEAAVEEADWMNGKERAIAKRFRALVVVLQENLKQIEVYRIGEAEANVYIVGTIEGGLAGVKTKVVEN